eukprot:Hpha_TRINITY_DN12846_c0_g1::TRINITY_DN12846_c0_g1_i1::g.24180::m.24180
MRRCAVRVVRSGHRRWVSSSCEGEEVLRRVALHLESDPSSVHRFGRCLGDSEVMQLSRACDEAGKAEVLPPSTAQLRLCAAAGAVPFVGFGFLDNMLMILFGEAMDSTLCVTFNFSTMAAAALGNTFSDAAGVFSGGLVEDMAEKGGFSAPPLSRAQEDMSQTRMATRVGQLVGVIVGCLLGMFPLWLTDTRKGEMLRRERDSLAALDEVCAQSAEGVSELLDAEAAIVMLVSPGSSELYTRGCWASGARTLLEIRAPVGEGIKGTVAATGKPLNISDVRRSPFWRAPPTPGRDWSEQDDAGDDTGAKNDSWQLAVANYRQAGVKVRSVLCMPIVAPGEGECDEVLGVIEVMNKRGGAGFVNEDEAVLSALCSHVAASVQQARGQEVALGRFLRTCKRSLCHPTMPAHRPPLPCTVDRP